MRGTRLRYRPVQAAAVATLAALITACATFAPLYDRAMGEALTDLAVDSAPTPVSGLQMQAIAGESTRFGEVASVRPTSPEGLVAALPSSIRSKYGDAILGYAAIAAREPDQAGDPRGEIVWRAGQCDHVRLVKGSCPSGAGQVLVSEKDVAEFGLEVGTRLAVVGEPRGGYRAVVPTSVPLHVAGVYRQRPGDYWFGTTLTGRSGQVDPAEQPPRPAHDVWLTDRATFSDGPLLPSLASTVDLPLDRNDLSADDLLSLGARVDRFIDQETTADGQMVVTVHTGLTIIAEEVRAQIDQSRVTVPLLMAQLAVLGVVVLWLVLAAVTEQRRPEAALARLRGRGRRGARRLLVGELLPAALGGVLPGVTGALLAAWVVRTVVLPGHAPFEMGAGFAVALLLAVVLLVAVTVLAASRVAREPVAMLLRRVPIRRPGWALGAVEALVLAGAGSLVAVFLAGGLRGPAALVAPGLLAVVVGLVLAHVTSPTAALVGRRLLVRGRVRAAVSALDAARSPATRRAVAIVTLATALAAFSADALVVGERNRASASEQEAGAPVVLLVDGTDLSGVEDALRSAGRDDATPVVRVRAPAPDAPEVVAVQPDAFRRIALFPGGTAPGSVWDRVVPPQTEPVTLRGAALSGQVAATTLQARQLGGGSTEVTLSADVATSGGQVASVTLGRVDAGAGSRRFSARVPCTDGCELTALRLSSLPGARLAGSFTLAGVRARGPVDVGPAGQWRPLRDPANGNVLPASDSRDRLTLHVQGLGASTLVLDHRWVPDRLRVLATGLDGADSSGGEGLQTLGLDAEDHPAQLVGRLPRVPASPPNTVVLDLDSASRAVTIAPDARIEVWLGSDDPALRTAVHQALQGQGVSVAETRTLTATRQRYDDSVAAWSLQLAGAVGAAALAIAVVVLLVGAASSWRVRARDLAALRMSGVGGRWISTTAVAAQLPAILVGVVAGTAAGVLGAQVAMPTFPLFAESPEVSTLDLQPAWGAIAVAALVSLLVLGATAALLGRATGRRSDVRRLRESL